ncbi:MAG: hypothetical protein EPN98_21760 [Phenylobacterium sp.]|uniref:hypothetical protein n=1 Tax=Phenylobacterium sp. TaxID=1871053 RepID=UPI0011FAD6D7|nr:hypothetical protein [Phenylobacterium sp.]TAL29071.1 MAG: hypothetical protein EPN98_21760 [Phenylobacterium sp.]
MTVAALSSIVGDPVFQPRRGGRHVVPGKITSGVSKASGGKWRYWTRKNGKMTFGPPRAWKANAERDRRNAIAGNPPAHPRKNKIKKADRPGLGLCVDCEHKTEPGRKKCAVHLKRDRLRASKISRALGLPTREQYLRTMFGPGKKAPHLTRDILDTKLGPVERCACGLMLPCHHPSIAEYASARPGE